MALIYVETRTKNMPDSGAWQIHKFGSGAGEQRIALEGSWITDKNIFDFYTKDVEFYFFTKSDMLDYISSIQEEIHHPTQKYSYKDYPTFYDAKVKEIKNEPSEIFVLHFEANPRNGGTAYLASISQEDSDSYNFLRSICLSSEKQGKNNAYTTFHFVKYQDTKTGKFYINLVPTFSKKYTMKELSSILKRALQNAEDVHVALNLFGLEYADQIISEGYDCQELLKLAECEDNDLVSELETAVEVFKQLKDNKVTINPISDKLSILGAYIENNQMEPIQRNDSDLYLQQITYGAPGTGKSFSIERDIKLHQMVDIRTTFHPDSDYSTFVGAYKPQMEKVIVRDDRGFPVKENDHVVEEKKIVYKYSRQAFLKSYIAAWKDMAHKHALVIEEINRGNCAQIFGDLFQLLDRNNAGFSCYPISPDSDITQELAEAFDGLVIESKEAIDALYKEEVVADVINGSKMLLPNNLYIWATMNTSDQSLFPIDSAFKRRWDWKYVPISNADKKWKIRVGKVDYDWWDFLEKINEKIDQITHSEDKKLGYFFCKPDLDNIHISSSNFVGKVLFYVYNDVFKDYGFDDDIFKIPGDVKVQLSFKDFFKYDGSPIDDNIAVFLNNLSVDNSPIENNVEEEPEEVEDYSSQPSTMAITIEDEEINEETAFDSYITALKKIGLQKVEPIASENVKEFNRFDCPLVSRDKFDAIKKSPKFSYVEVDGYNVVQGLNKSSMMKFLKLLGEKLNINIEVE